MGLVFLGLLATFTLAPGRSAEPRPDVVIADFEAAQYGDWKSTGEAFGQGPAAGTLTGQQPVSNFEGKGLVNSFNGGDSSTGTLISPTFTLERRFINLLVGGGLHPSRCFVRLSVEGKPIAMESGYALTGGDDEHLSWRSWDLEEHLGKRARVEIVDQESGSWGHILVDQIVQSDTAKVAPDGGPIVQAMASVAGAERRAKLDPDRPGWHAMPPALWCNDPNGPIFHEGYYHLFYQHNPYGDRWERMHWGHLRSKDLVNWEHLPIALAPSYSSGEDHCFSGSAAVNDRGEVLLFYTSIGKRDPEQWAARATDRSLMTWEKFDSNPILHMKDHRGGVIDEWRDPFAFRWHGKSYLVVGGHPRKRKGGIMLYAAEDESLEKWKYLGVAFEGTEKNWECPNLLPMDETRALLLYSPHDRVRYHVGTLEVESCLFTPTSSGVFDHGGDYYATSGCRDGQGRWLVWGWIRGFPGGKGWNGCLSLPRVVSLGEDGRLQQSPADELEKLRVESVAHMDEVTLQSKRDRIARVETGMVEIAGTLSLGKADRVGLKIFVDEDDQATATVFIDRRGIEVSGARADLDTQGPVRWRIFVDRTVVEVFANDIVLTKVVRPILGASSIELFADGGPAVVNDLRVWPLSVPTTETPAAR